MSHTSISLARPTRRTWLAMGAALALPLPALAAPFNEIAWTDLVPQGWDPAKSMRDQPGLAGLSDTDPRAQEMLDELRKIWDNAPTVPTMAGRSVKLPGYLVPLEEGKDGIREFLLVPYFGACIHTPPPPSNQIVLGRAAKPFKGLRTMDAVWASGTLQIERAASSMGVASYVMQVERVVKYQGS
ncbi:DUF3299 domain-containing protein [Pseudorhodoferax sp. Leaf267]|uniref:DUF3299 domain-containing protein n=1 Tax=Pseudorhodoferax sp. Leaf267 TaxID=1736316 RepID=UPI0006F74639|nr:DUF3299 domain-containing protein [Pseudorhodoferax sp. Leaf267]KQP18044.1 hypothetical protein ASF43_09320 [Pseudorhodoferax sp. Leaf267]